MLSFIKAFLRCCGNILGIAKLSNLSSVLPSSLHQAKKFLGRLQDKFERYVLCSVCHALYKYHECIAQGTTRGTQESTTCSFVSFPNHSQARMRAPCGNILLKKVKSPTGSIYLAPFQTFCYYSIIESLRDLLNRPGILEQCEHWRLVPKSSDRLRDVYDGQVWKHFMYDSDGVPFLASPNNFLLMLNCDWFQPFRHTTFSVGVVYIVVANLPRHIRFTRDHILLVGIIPGPTEPKRTINTYLEPMVEDLLSLWKGVPLIKGSNNVVIRGALSCVACDVPAGQKLGGFIGHKGKRGCTKCLKEFPTTGIGDYTDYSGFKKADWEPRTHGVQVWFALKAKHAQTKDERESIESSHGARYSLLYRLPYYDAISALIIDPIHCLFLGIAKRVFESWVKNNVIHKEHFQIIQQKVDSFCCPPDIGRIPYKLGSKFSGLKADQWKNWTLYFSLYALKGLIPHRDYACWLLFVKLCYMICQRELAESKLLEIDSLAEMFCTSFLNLYGKPSLAPNMHLLAHISDCIRDHGPVYAFWLYAFERMNGVLGTFQTNNVDTSVQLMRKFLRMQDFCVGQWPDDIKNDFSFVLKDCKLDSDTGSENLKQQIQALPPLVEKSFDELEIEEIRTLIRSMYPDSEINIVRLYRMSKAIVLKNSIKLAAASSPYSHSSKVFIDSKLVEINHFLLCTVLGTESSTDHSFSHQHWLACCSKFTEHVCKPWYGYPTEVWGATTESDCFYSLVSSITHRVVYVKATVNFGHIIGDDAVLVVIPINIYD